MDVIIEKLDWRGVAALIFKYAGKIVFWLTLGAVTSGAISELPTPFPDNWVAIPMFLIWALGALVILKRMIAARHAIR